MIKTNRIGKTNVNNYGSLMKVVEYKNNKDITVLFSDYGNFKKAGWDQFIKGSIRNPFDKTAYGVGYLGEGEFKSKEKGKETHQYTIWRKMLDRCYSKISLEKNQTYKGCIVCEEWHNFQNFAKWYDKNYYIIDDEQMNLDKDILVKGNKIYSPETCVFVPHRINSLFIKSDKSRGKLPIGVSWDKKSKKYKAYCNVGNRKQQHIGFYDTSEEAFYAYKEFKESYIKDVANEYKGIIPDNLYQEMINYVVEITD